MKLFTLGELSSLNRTFYGIETNFVVGGNLEAKRLNRTFYGIETRDEHRCFYLNEGLNRTFYGIETLTDVDTTGAEIVLIVPFMELKRLL